MARMRERQHAAELRPATPVPAPEVPAPLPAADADGVTIVPDVMPHPDQVRALVTPPADQVRRAAGTMWWAAQSPAIADDQRERLLEARAQVLQESALA